MPTTLVTPTGRFAAPMLRMREMLADCAAWQDWIGADDAETALEAIHIVTAPPPLGGDEVPLAEAESTVPLAIIDTPEEGEAFTAQRVASGTRHFFRDSGTLLLSFFDAAPIPRHLADSELKVIHANRLGDLIDQILTLAGSGTATRSYLSINRLMVLYGPSVAHEDEETGRGRSVISTLGVDWEL